MCADDWLRQNAIKPDTCPLDRHRWLWLWRLGFVGGGFIFAVWLGAFAALVSVRADPSSRHAATAGVRELHLEEDEKEPGDRLENGLQAEIEAKTAQRSD